MHHGLKYTVSNLNENKPLSHYINPDIINQYANKEGLEDVVQVNANVKIEKIKKGVLKNKKKDNK